jgi:hypothetical protein
MGIFENVIKAVEQVLLPKLAEIQTEQKAQRELMEERFKGVNQRFDDLVDRLELHRRIAVLEDRQANDRKAS